VNKIDSYRFGEILINGQKYTTDVIIFPDSVISDRWRKAGHELCRNDIDDVLKEKPQVLVVGSGASGLMKVLPEVEEITHKQGIELVVETTDKACDVYNRMCDSQFTVAVFHITC